MDRLFRIQINNYPDEELLDYSSHYKHKGEIRAKCPSFAILKFLLTVEPEKILSLTTIHCSEVME